MPAVGRGGRGGAPSRGPGADAGEVRAPRIDLAGPAVHSGRWVPDRVGTALGRRYELIEQCGTGGMAAVYRARDRRLGREVAVKVPAPQYAQRPEFAERFRREAQAAAGLNHPNVVAVYDWGEDAEVGVHYLVMELVRGPSLRELLRVRGVLPEAEALRVAEEVAVALEAAHEAGVVHRDVKPPNILFDLSGRVKVADFGIARVASWQQITETTTVMGTAKYLSPEQADMRPIDHRTDLYSLGVVLYEMLVGRPPFDGDSPVAIALRQIRDRPTPPRRLRPELSADAEAIVLRALEKDPAARFQSAAEMRTALAAARARGGERWDPAQMADGTAAVGPPAAGDHAVPTAGGAGVSTVEWAPAAGSTAGESAGPGWANRTAVSSGRTRPTDRAPGRGSPGSADSPTADGARTVDVSLIGGASRPAETMGAGGAPRLAGAATAGRAAGADWRALVARRPLRAAALAALGALVLLIALALAAGELLGGGGATACAAELESLRARLPAVVGDCVAAARVDAASGDLVQPTTRGTLRLRQADRAPLFTAGDQVWVDGPYGLQQRRGDERFAWEAPSP